jgi:CHASE3 domain sensor protein
MAEDAYNDVMSELKQRAIAGDEVAKEQIKKIGATMASLSPEMQKEFQKGIGGDISAQQKLFMRMPSLMKNVMDESVSTAQTMKEGERDINNFIDTFGRSYRYNAEGMREFAGGLASARAQSLQTGQWP